MSIAQGNDAKDPAVQWIARVLAHNYTDGACGTECGSICDCFGMQRTYALRGARAVHAELTRRRANAERSIEAMEDKLGNICEIVRELEHELESLPDKPRAGVTDAKRTFNEYMVNRLRTAVGMAVRAGDAR